MRASEHTPEPLPDRDCLQKINNIPFSRKDKAMEIFRSAKLTRASSLHIFLAGLILAVCCSVWGSLANAASTKVIVLTDSAGLGDKGFNDVCWQGVLKAKKDFGIDAQFLQAREQADYVSNLTLAAGKADIVVTLGYLFIDSLKEVVPRFPKTRFIHIEGEIPGDNIASFDFRSEEAGFLAGVTAGLFTKKNMVGVVSGMEIPPVEAYLSGFRAGIRTAEAVKGRKIEAIIATAGSFNDPVKGKSLAKALIDKGVDVIFRAAGNTGVGVNDAVKSSNGVYLIAEDLDQDAEMPGKILTSALKRMDVAVYNAIRDGRIRAVSGWTSLARGVGGCNRYDGYEIFQAVIRCA